MRGAFWLPAIENPTIWTRGCPSVTPMSRAQWFDQFVRLPCRMFHSAKPTFTSLRARLLSTCVNWPMYSRLTRSSEFVLAGCWVALGVPNGMRWLAPDTFPISRMLGEIW